MSSVLSYYFILFCCVLFYSILLREVEERACGRCGSPTVSSQGPLRESFPRDTLQLPTCALGVSPTRPGLLVAETLPYSPTIPQGSWKKPEFLDPANPGEHLSVKPLVLAGRKVQLLGGRVLYVPLSSSYFIPSSWIPWPWALCTKNPRHYGGGALRGPPGSWVQVWQVTGM